MKITDLRASLLKHPLPGEFHPTWGTGLVLTELPMTLIQLETEEGITGYGALPANSLEGCGVNVFIRNSLIGRISLIRKRSARCFAMLTRMTQAGVEDGCLDVLGKLAGNRYINLGGLSGQNQNHTSLSEVRSAEERAERCFEA